MKNKIAGTIGGLAGAVVLCFFGIINQQPLFITIFMVVFGGGFGYIGGKAFSETIHDPSSNISYRDDPIFRNDNDDGTSN